MEIVVGRDYVYGRFNTSATVVTVLEGYTPVEIRLQNNRTCWVHRAELREKMSDNNDDRYENSPSEPGAEKWDGNEMDYTWSPFPRPFTLEEDISYEKNWDTTTRIKKGTTLYIRASHDVYDVFILADGPGSGAHVFTASGQWVMMQISRQKGEERKIKGAAVLADALDKVLEDEKETTKQNRRTLLITKIDRVADMMLRISPWLFFAISLGAVVLDQTPLAIWLMLAAIFFMVSASIDAIYLVIYNMVRKHHADSE